MHTWQVIGDQGELIKDTDSSLLLRWNGSLQQHRLFVGKIEDCNVLPYFRVSKEIYKLIYLKKSNKIHIV